MHQPDYSISTPENVDLHLEIAGLGNRLLAQLIDGAIMLGVFLFILLVGVLCAFVVTAGSFDSQTKSILFAVILMIIIFLLFVVQYGYFVVFEGLWRGQTPGKRMAEIRVIEQNGQPIGWAAAIIRNLIRIIDSIMFLGIIFILIDKNERRLGDMAAGTIVIRERKTEISTSQIKMLTAAKADASVDVGRVTPGEYDILVDFLRRRESLAKAHRPTVAQKLAVHFKEKLNDDGALLADRDEAGKAVATLSDDKAEEYLERLYLTYQQRAQD
ncbi:MAG: RDD family protein [Cyanobacteria bacterium SZAS LIN-2]|nr:RDD family protein [Cyanobacteria bacterium SZAS LIN-3]MBS1996919.1 RDD family protein [Cyanobacteria bacterium SZAS LIN-2]MBS2010189.1 RDD family protein [Cyanobacteria bacterium SZAS TMP-1]